MPNQNINLSQQSIYNLCRLSCYKQRLLDAIVGFIFLGLSIFAIVLYHWAEDGPIAETWKECAPYVIVGCLGTSAVWFIMACFRSPLAWVRGEPEDSEILLVCIKRCFCCNRRSSNTSVYEMPSRPDPDNYSTNSMNIQRSISSILLSLHRSSKKQPPIQETNTELDDSDGRWMCIKCIWCQKSNDQEASTSTINNGTQSITDPPHKSSPEKDMEMIVLNSGQHGPADDTNSSDSEKMTSVKRRLSRQQSDPQESTQELSQLDTDPANFSKNLSKEIETEIGNASPV